jgi:hypothetical protein
MRKNYQTYDEIPALMREYVLTVADRKVIEEIPLEEINMFLQGLHQYYKNKEETYEDGWA